MQGEFGTIDGFYLLLSIIFIVAFFLLCRNVSLIRKYAKSQLVITSIAAAKAGVPKKQINAVLVEHELKFKEDPSEAEV